MIRFGQRLSEVRKKRGLTIEAVAKATKIRSHFIVAIEKGDYRNMPSTAYIQGFVKNYVAFLGLPQREMLSLFRREFDEREFITVLPESFTKKTEISLKPFKLQQTIIVTVFIILILCVYLLYQYRYAFLNPPISLDTPKESQVLHSQQVTITGETQPNTTVTVNNEPTFVDSNGNFKKTITLFSGAQTIVVKVVNTFGRIQILERHVQVKT